RGVPDTGQESGCQCHRQRHGDRQQQLADRHGHRPDHQHAPWPEAIQQQSGRDLGGGRRAQLHDTEQAEHGAVGPEAVGGLHARDPEGRAPGHGAQIGEHADRPDQMGATQTGAGGGHGAVITFFGGAQRAGGGSAGDGASPRWCASWYRTTVCSMSSRSCGSWAELPARDIPLSASSTVYGAGAGPAGTVANCPPSEARAAVAAPTSAAPSAPTSPSEASAGPAPTSPSPSSSGLFRVPLRRITQAAIKGAVIAEISTAVATWTVATSTYCSNRGSAEAMIDGVTIEFPAVVPATKPMPERGPRRSRKR